MKKIYKSLSIAALSGVLCLTLSLSANAQHHNNAGGGGGGGSSAGGGGGGSARPSSPAPVSSGFSGHVSAPQPSRPAASNNNYTPRPNVSRVNPGNNAVSQRSVGIARQNGIVQRGVSATPYSGHIGINSRTNRVNGNGATNAQSYRTYQGSIYGKNHPGSPYRRGGSSIGYMPGRTSYHYNRGYYGSYYYPRLGFSLGYLPYGYYPFYYGDYQYFYSDGLFYQYNNDEYTVVEPPVGAEVKTLPANAQSIVINGQQYYEVNGVYYEPITKDDGTLSYQVAGKDGELNTDDQSVDNAQPAPQIGDIVPELPPNCRKININGEKLYLSPDGVYFKAQLDQDNNKVYKIVGLPADDDQGQQQQGGDQGGN